LVGCPFCARIFYVSDPDTETEETDLPAYDYRTFSSSYSTPFYTPWAVVGKVTVIKLLGYVTSYFFM
jgi:hypothetical protein